MLQEAGISAGVLQTVPLAVAETLSFIDMCVRTQSFGSFASALASYRNLERHNVDAWQRNAGWKRSQSRERDTCSMSPDEGSQQGVRSKPHVRKGYLSHHHDELICISADIDRRLYVPWIQKGFSCDGGRY